MDKKIFISHSVANRDFAQLLLAFLTDLGCRESEIFYSSNPVTGVRDRISEEVLSALQTSRLDVILLSNEYKSSAYCLNEAGVIWYKGKDTKKIVILLHDVVGDKTAGFIDEDHLQFRMSEHGFLKILMDRLLSFLAAENAFALPEVDRINKACQTLKDGFRAYEKKLPIVKNLTSYVDHEITEQERSRVIKAQNNIYTGFVFPIKGPQLTLRQILRSGKL